MQGRPVWFALSLASDSCPADENPWETFKDHCCDEDGCRVSTERCSNEDGEVAWSRGTYVPDAR